MLRKLGKFIKKGSKVLEVNSIKDFSFENISSTHSVIFDNQSHSLIQTDLHSKESLESIVNPENRCDLDLVSSENKRHLLWPVDFTKELRHGEEYSKLLLNYKPYNTDADKEEDDFSYGMEDLTKESESEDEPDFASMVTIKTPETESQSLDKTPVSNNTISEESGKETSSSTFNSTQEFKPLSDSLTSSNTDNVNVVDSNTVSQTSNSEPKLDLSSDSNEESNSKEGSEKDQDNLLSTKEHISESKPKLEDDNSKVDAYLNKDLSGMSEKLEEEYKRGYEAAKQELESQSLSSKKDLEEQAKVVTKNMNSIVDGLKGLKKNVLASASKNYCEIAQAVSETLIRKELKVDEKNLMNLIHQAIKKIPDNQIQIKVSKTMYDKLLSLNMLDDDVKNIIQPDSSVEDGDFRIESDFNVIDGSVYNLVKEVLSGFDLNLFDNKSKDTDESDSKEKQTEEANLQYSKAG